MRWIRKQQEPPPALAGFLAVQLPLGLNVDYENGFTRKPQLRQELIAEQCGLCGYTGAPVDQRLGNLAVADEAVRFGAHIEHLKPQSVCRAELEARGLEPGRDLGEDMDHRNMIAALLVEGAKAEQFGAVRRGNRNVAIFPTHQDCESRFRFHDDGRIEGRDPQAVATIDALKLDHDTLNGWRRVAIEVFLSPEAVRNRQELDDMIGRLDLPANGQLVEYCFAIKSVALTMRGPV